MMNASLELKRKNCLAAGIFAETTLSTVFHDVPGLAMAVVYRVANVDGAGNILVPKLCRQSIELGFKVRPSDCDLNVKKYDVVRIAFNSDGRSMAGLYKSHPHAVTENFEFGN